MTVFAPKKTGDCSDESLASSNMNFTQMKTQALAYPLFGKVV